VNDEETEKSALCSKVGASSQMGAKRKEKKTLALVKWWGKLVMELNLRFHSGHHSFGAIHSVEIYKLFCLAFFKYSPH
jgi:hypothetical protein